MLCFTPVQSDICKKILFTHLDDFTYSLVFWNPLLLYIAFLESLRAAVFVRYFVLCFFYFISETHEKLSKGGDEGWIESESLDPLSQ